MGGQPIMSLSPFSCLSLIDKYILGGGGLSKIKKEQSIPLRGCLFHKGKKHSDGHFVNASPLKESFEAVFNTKVSEPSTTHPWKLPSQTFWWKGVYEDHTCRTQHLKC